MTTLLRRTITDTDLDVSAFCLGVPHFGSTTSDEQADRLFERFREVGGSCFDTAHCYAFYAESGGAGSSERGLAACIKRHGGMKDIVIATKGGHPSAGPRYERSDQYLSAKQITSDIDDSLRNLGLERIDLYYLHRDDLRRPVGEMMETLNTEIRRGRLRYIAASNWSPERIKEANAYVGANGLRGFVASSVRWSLGRATKAFPDETVPPVRDSDIQWHRDSGFPLIPWSSTANGYFATGGQSGAGTYDNPVSRRRLNRARELARELGATPNQIALAYLLHQGFPVIPILGTGNMEHLSDALDAGRLRLTGQQVDDLTGPEGSS